MLRISRLTDYGTVLLARLAAARQQQMTAAQLSAQTRIPLATVSKLLKRMQQRGLVVSTRGLHGGYRLARAPEHISAAQVLDAFEGPLALTACASHDNSCGIEHSCGVHRAWQRVNLAIRRTLADISLLELAGLAAQPIRFAALERLQQPARR
jgi:FeS assembly SUF system regulator